MIESIKDDLEALFKANLQTELTALGDAKVPAEELVAPKEYYHFFHPQMRYSSIPGMIIDQTHTDFKEEAVLGSVADLWHHIDLIILLQDNNLEKLWRKESRYADAVISVLKKNPQYGAMADVSILTIAYDRTVRGEETKLFFSSVWLITSIKERRQQSGV